MALTDRYIPIRLSQGVETEQDEKTLEPGQPTDLQNAVVTKRITFEKRYGTRSLPKTRVGAVYTAISGCVGLTSRDNENDLVMLASSDEILSWDDAAEVWIPRGTWTMLRQTADGLPRGSSERWDPTIATVNNVRGVAWEDARGGVYAQLFNAETMVPYGSDFRVGGSLTRCPTALNVGNQLLVFMVSGTSPPSLHVGRINVADPSAAGVTMSQLHSSLWSQAPYYAVSTIGTHGSASLVVASQSGSLYACYVSSDGQLLSSVSTPRAPDPVSGTYGTAISPAIAMSPDGTRAMIAYKAFAPLSGVQGWTLQVPTLTTVNDSVIVDANTVTDGYGTVNRITAACLTGTAGVYTYQVTSEVSASSATDRYLRTANVLSTSSVSFVSGNLIRHSSLASNAFLLGGRPYVWTTQVSPLQSTDFLVRTDDGVTVARSRYGQCMPDISGILGTVEVTGNIAYRAATNREVLQLPSAPISASAYGGRHPVLLTTNYHPSSSWRPVDIDGVLYMPGGWPGTYDGASVVEHGFALKSEGTVATPSSNGAGGDPFAIGGGASFLWAVVPEWFDAKGNRYLGGYTEFVTGTLSGSQNQASLSIRTVAHTMKDGIHAQDFSWRIYRTGPNATVLQYVGSVTNQTGSDRVTFVDTVSETQRSFGEVFYAADGGAGGAVNMNSMPESPAFLALASDRLFAAGLESDPYTIAVSKLVAGAAPQFTDGNEISVEARGGPVTSLSAMDDRLITFKASRLYAIEGFPDTDLASDSTPWPLPALITADVGAPEPAVVCEAAGTTVQGLVFKSVRGVRLLDRSLKAVDIGGPVRGFDGLSLVGGTSPSLANEVRLYTSTGRTLVLNTRWDQWSTFTPQPAVAACTWQGNPSYADPLGHVWVEDTGSYLDQGTPYSMTIELGWTQLQGSLQGLSRVRQLLILGDYFSPHTLRVELGYDYRDTWYTVRDIDVTAAIGVVPYGGGVSGSSAIGYGSGSYGGSDPIYQFRVDLPVQRMESLRLRLSDQSASGRSFDLTELKLRVASESDKPRLPTRKIR